MLNLDKRHKWMQLKMLVKTRLKKDNSGHDYPHIRRVLKNALALAKKYKNIDYDVLVVSCLLHDIVFNKKRGKLHHIDSAKESKRILSKFNFPKDKINEVYNSIINHNRSYAPKGTQQPINKMSTEAKIMFDADNLDCFGKPGLRRIIAFSKKQGVPKFISKKDDVDQSLYGNIKYLIKRSKFLTTKNGRYLVKKRLGVLKKYLKRLENKNLAF